MKKIHVILTPTDPPLRSSSETVFGDGWIVDDGILAILDEGGRAVAQFPARSWQYLVSHEEVV